MRHRRVSFFVKSTVDRKILILVDNCTAQNVSLNLQDTKLVFISANTTYEEVPKRNLTIRLQSYLFNFLKFKTKNI